MGIIEGITSLFHETTPLEVLHQGVHRRKGNIQIVTDLCGAGRPSFDKIAQY